MNQRQTTGVLDSAEYIVQHSEDVHVSEKECREAAVAVYEAMKLREYSPATWSTHTLAPRVVVKGSDLPNTDTSAKPPTSEESAVDWVFMVDTLNFSFWSDYDDQDTGLASTQRYTVVYQGQAYTGYWSLCAAINKALSKGIPITSPKYWASPEFTKEVVEEVFKSETKEKIPLVEERYRVLKEAGRVITEKFQVGSFAEIIPLAKQSAVELVKIVTENFSSYNDVSEYKGRKVHLFKRAQILVSDLWACFNERSYGSFKDIDDMTMFADYRVPQILESMKCVEYSARLKTHLRNLQPLNNGDPWEVEIRGASIWVVELIRREIKRRDPDARVNAVLIDFYLWDLAKELQKKQGGVKEGVPCHRTRSVFY